MIKRLFDIVVAVSGLTVLLPVWLIASVAIWLEDGSPVVLRQPRVGQGGRTFRAFKFRSMRPGTERLAPRQASEHDARVTRVGRVLRRTAMDELPQLLNIVRGDMSVVGPRPLLPGEVEVRGPGHEVPLHAIPGYAERHQIRPGLTGLAQIYAPRDAPRARKFRLDRLYVQHANLCFDLALILLSFRITLRGRWEVRHRKI
jgi:lipopolysaccharide/colanic/teichoic acid biosynthesis glycosyltransferase